MADKSLSRATQPAVLSDADLEDALRCIAPFITRANSIPSKFPTRLIVKLEDALAAIRLAVQRFHSGVPIPPAMLQAGIAPMLPPYETILASAHPTDGIGVPSVPTAAQWSRWKDALRQWEGREGEGDSAIGRDGDSPTCPDRVSGGTQGADHADVAAQDLLVSDAYREAWQRGMRNDDAQDSAGPIVRTIDGITLIRTCSACPEQYECFRDGKDVAYLRLRHGYFRVECGEDNWVYEASPRGDGEFEADERGYYLGQAVAAIRHWEANPTWEIDSRRSVVMNDSPSGQQPAPDHPASDAPLPDSVQSHVDAIVTDLRSGAVKPKQREAVRDALQDAAVGSIIGGRRG